MGQAEETPITTLITTPIPIPAPTYTRARARARTGAHAHTNARARAHTHTHTHTHIRIGHTAAVAAVSHIIDITAATPIEAETALEAPGTVSAIAFAKSGVCVWVRVGVGACEHEYPKHAGILARSPPPSTHPPPPPPPPH